MLDVIDLDEARDLIGNRFDICSTRSEDVPLERAAARIIACDVIADEGVPAFNRSTVDGFAVVASDTFGCSDALPALLALAGEVEMGAAPTRPCASGTCIRIPTGGQVPEGADAVVMLEYCEEYGDGTIGVTRAAAPGSNIVFAHDDVAPGQMLIRSGTRLLPHHIGTLASLGRATCPVREQVRVGIISTGDEIIPVEEIPIASQMRDVNAPVLAAAVESLGAKAVRYPIVPDDFEALRSAVDDALESCDMVLVSGGSSAGQKDNTARVLSQAGELLFHGIAVKPGKPTLCVDADGKPAFGLPGHPVAAYLMFLELARPLLEPTRNPRAPLVHATLAEAVPSNHGRAELVAVRIEARGEDAMALPVRGKSGLISQLGDADGYIEIPRNQEGLAAGASVRVKLFT